MSLKIAHLADLQVRFGSRHEEFRTVFQRTIDDLKTQTLDRIFIAGDLFHHKIQLSPNSIKLLSWFLIELSSIAPTDIIIGNHDLNLQQLEQGDSLSPLFDIVNMVQKGKNKAAYFITEQNKNNIDFNQNAVYYYIDSGFYRIRPDLVYGVYSLKDGKILKLEEKNKEIGVNYVALYHGTICGSRDDGGREMKGDNLIKLSVFNNFSIVLAGDIHEYQVLEGKGITPSAIYSGSLLQNNNGESIKKGYLLWDIEKKTHIRRFIPNDYGFINITIARGENWEERLKNLETSLNSKKTKFWIRYQGFQEEESVEKKNQITRYIKDIYGAESINVEFDEIPRDIILENEKDSIQKKESEEYLKEFLNNGTFDVDKDLFDDITKLHRETNTLLEIDEKETKGAEWEPLWFEISNLFTFPVEPTKIDFDAMPGLLGILGENYAGKTNTLRAFVWWLYDTVLGSEGASENENIKHIVNKYTGHNKAYVKGEILINSEIYFISRTIKRTVQKDGTIKNSYHTEFKRTELEYDEEGNLENEKLVNVENDEKANEQNAVKELVEQALGTFDDFTKTSLQSQSSKDDYTSMKQQPKNQLVSRYLGLQNYRTRYEHCNSAFNDIKKKQKDLGDIVKTEEHVLLLESQKKEKQKQYDLTLSEKQKAVDKKEKTDLEILELTKTLEKLEPTEISSKSEIESQLNKNVADETTMKVLIHEKEEWLSVNFKKQLPFEEGMDINKLNKSLQIEQASFKTDREAYVIEEKWIKDNSIQKEHEVVGINDEIQKINEEIGTLNNQIKVYKGKKCPTCNNVSAAPDPIKEKQCSDEIIKKTTLLSEKKSIIKKNETIRIHNADYINKTDRLANLKQSLLNKKESIDILKSKIEVINNSKDIIDHNALVDKTAGELKSIKTKFDTCLKAISKLKDNLEKVISNESKILKNADIQEKINLLSETIKSQKLVIYNLDNQLNGYFGEIKVIESNLSLLFQKLSEIKYQERLFKKYSIYLQSQHRDGIPFIILSRKIPLVNSKINSILQQVVPNLKINLSLTPSGDITEFFYYNDPSYGMPISLSSGSQRFIFTAAIKEGLHYVSTLQKPSISMIDEGFGTLDDKMIIEVCNMLTYLKNRHKNVVIITHRSDIKDVMDHIVEATKSTDGIPKGILDKNPDAYVTKLSAS